MKRFFSLLLSLVMIFSVLPLVCFAQVGDAVPFKNSRYFECGDYSLHYRTYGDSRSCRAKVMLLHGFGLSSACLRVLLLNMKRKVILLLLRTFRISAIRAARRTKPLSSRVRN